MSFLHKNTINCCSLEERELYQDSIFCTIWLYILKIKKLAVESMIALVKGAVAPEEVCARAGNLWASQHLLYIYSTTIHQYSIRGLWVCSAQMSHWPFKFIASKKTHHTLVGTLLLPSVSHLSERHPISHPGTKPALGAASSGRWADGGHLHRQ